MSCFDIGLLVSVNSNVTISSKSVNLHCKYLKQNLNLKKLYTFILYVVHWVFDEDGYWVWGNEDMLEHKCFRYPRFSLLVDSITPSIGRY